MADKSLIYMVKSIYIYHHLIYFLNMLIIDLFLIILMIDHCLFCSYLDLEIKLKNAFNCSLYAFRT